MNLFEKELRSKSLSWDDANEVIELFNDALYLRIDPIEFIANRKFVHKNSVINWLHSLKPLFLEIYENETLEENERFEQDELFSYDIIDIKNNPNIIAKETDIL